MDSSEDELLSYLKEQFPGDNNSYEAQLEQQKTVLLVQQEKEYWKRLLYETERFREQYLREDHLELKQLVKLEKYISTLNEPRFKTVIDQNLDRWLNDDNGARYGYQVEIDELRSRIDRMKQQAAQYKEVFEKVQESRSHQMVQDSLRQVREEETKLEVSQMKIDYLWKTNDEQVQNEWKEMKLIIVEFSQLFSESKMLDTEKDAILQNNDIKKTKIIQLHEEIEQAKVEQEEEAKRREIELNERLLIPIKITPMTLENPIFKNPNDFPTLINKIESTRKSYEQIFKRPEHMKHKLRKKDKSLRSKNVAKYKWLLAGYKRDVLSGTSKRTVTNPIISAENIIPTKQQHHAVILKRLLSVNNTKHLDSIAGSELTTSQISNAKQPMKDSNELNKANISEDFLEEPQRPICNVQAQQINRRSSRSTSQPEPDTPEPPSKRSSMDPPISTPAPPKEKYHRELKKSQPEKASRKSKPKKVSFLSQPEQFSPEMENVATSPDGITRPRSRSQPVEQSENDAPSPSQPQREQPITTNAINFDPAEQQKKAIDEDNFSVGSSSPPTDSLTSKDDDGSFFDTGSIVSFDMEDREGNSDLGFDLSPVGPTVDYRQDDEGDRSGHDDFDFLASPTRSTAALGSQDGGKKGQDCFAFTDDDSGAGFDFF